MKQKTALKQAKVSLRFLSVLIPIFVVLSIWLPNAYTIVPLTIFSLSAVMEVLVITRMRKRAAEDPSFLDKRLY